MKNKTTQFNIDSRQSRAGAMACLKAMKDVRQIIGNGANSRVVYDKKCADSERAMLKAAEPGLSSFMKGFVTAFAEYICLEHSGTVLLENWVPYAAMTEADAEAGRANLWKEEKAGGMLALYHRDTESLH